MTEVVAERDPSDATCADIGRLAPEIPYYTMEYRDAMQSCGKEVWGLGLEADGQLVCGCLGEISAGRLRKELHIQSTPSNPDGSFWSGLEVFCRREKITTLSLGTIGTTPAIPDIARVVSQKDRCEYWVDLQAPDVEMVLRPQQRRVLRKARERGLEIRIPQISAGVDTHKLLTRASLGRRRDRGEDIPIFDETGVPQALIESGAARIFECVFEEEVLGSAIMTVAERGVHGYSAGFSPNGMKLGAAVFLNVATFHAMQSEQKSVFNLGDAPRDSGLAVFKRGLGAQLHESQSKTFDTASATKNLLIAGCASLSRLRTRFQKTG